MKKYSIIILATCVAVVHAEKYRYIGYSFYNPSPVPFVSLTKTMGGKELSRNDRLEVLTSFTRSYDSEQIASYLSPVNKTELRVKESVLANVNPLVDQGAQDILSYNFNIVTNNGNFESLISFSPVKKVWSCDLSYYKEFYEYWLYVMVPLMYMETDMHLQEQIIHDGGGSINDIVGNFNIAGLRQAGNMKEAFACKAMKYGKIDGKQKKGGLSDVIVKIGTEYEGHQKYVRPFMGMILPFGNKPTAEYMFEPILGNGRHVGLIVGSEFGAELARNDTRTLFFSSLMEIRYLLPNYQLRSFDPAGKPWGRYMAMFANPNDMSLQRYSFGINESTKLARTQGGIQCIVSAKLAHICDTTKFELSYQNIIHAANRTETPHEWGFPAIAGIVQPEAQTNPARGINTLLDDFKSTQYYGIQKDQISTQTACHRPYIAHKIMGSCKKTFHRNHKKYYVESGIGATLGATNSAPYEWSIQLAMGCCV